MSVATNFLPEDDFQHPVGDHPAWSESYYFFWSDAISEIAGFSRIGTRANEGNIEGLHGVYLGGTRIAFKHARQSVQRDHTELSAGGLSFDRIEPMKRWKVRFDGEVQDIPDGKVLETPSKERLPGWHTLSRLEMDIDFDVLDPPYNFPSLDNGTQEHFEHFGRVAGTVRIAGIDAKISGYGIRDHSWGPRTWKLKDFNFPRAPGVPLTSYKWLVGMFGPDAAFAVSLIADEQGVHRGDGLFMQNGEHKVFSDVVATSEYLPGSVLHKSMHMVGTVDGKKFEARGEVVNHIPTKIVMPDGTTTFITEGLTRWHTPEGRQAMGIAEYHVKVGPRNK